MDTATTITLEKPAYGGYTIGYARGKAVMVPFGAPHETVRVSIIDDRRDYSIGEIIEYIETSPSRIAPPCPHYAVCGGCDYLHLTYEAELDIKRLIVIDSLARIGGLRNDDLPEVKTIRGDRFHYRSHATLKASSGRHGFYRRGSNDLVAIDSTGCLLLAPELNDWIMGQPASPHDYRAAIDTEGRVVTSFSGDRVVRESTGRFHFSRDVSCFFQANRFLRPIMIEIVRELAKPSPNETLLDIGCGIGFFTIPCGSGCSFVRGIDSNPQNIRWARINGNENDAPGIDFVTMGSSRLHPARHGSDVVIVDPPRSGLDRATRRAILTMGPGRLVYISCNPSTFSRDARDFVSGGYRLETITMIDMFPGTRHIEIIGLFIRAIDAPTP